MFGIEELKTRIAIIEERIKKINDYEMDMEKIKTHVLSLRGLMNRKLSGDKAEELKIEENAEPQVLLGPSGLPVAKRKV